MRCWAMPWAFLCRYPFLPLFRSSSRDPNYTSSKNRKHRKELKALLRNIYDSLGRYPGYRTIMTALHERGYKCGRQMARELLRTLWYED